MTIDLRYLTGGATVIVYAIIKLQADLLSLTVLWVCLLLFGIALLLHAFGKAVVTTTRSGPAA